MRSVHLIAAAFAVMFPALAQAACQHTPLRLDSGTRYSMQMVVERDTDCTVFGSAAATPFAEGVSSFLGVSVVQRPRAGIAGSANAHQWGYKPNPGFVGRDHFAVRMRYIRNTRTQPEATVIDVDVIVR